MRIVYSPLDALALAQAEPEREVVFFGVGFETTAPAIALTLIRARELDVRNFSVFANHVLVAPALRAILDSPDTAIDGFIGPGHVSTVIGTRPYDFIAEEYHRPVVVSGFEPTDILQAVARLLHQLRDGRAAVENQYGRVVRDDGNPAALAALERVFTVREDFEWRGLGVIPRSGFRIGDEFADWDAREPLRGSRRADRGSEGMPVRRRPPRHGEAVRVRRVRHRVHAREAARHVHGLERGRVRRVLRVRPAPREDAGMSDAVVTMADGAGGKASRRLVEELFLPELRNPLLEPLSDAALFSVGGARVALTTDSYVVRPLVFPGGDIGELAVNGTVNDLAVSGAVPVALTAGFVIEEGFPLDDLRVIARSLARAAAAANVSIAAGDTKVVERGAADGLYITTAGVGLVDSRVALGPERVEPGDRVLVSGGIAEHGIAVMMARGNLALELDVESDTAPLHEIAALLYALGGDLRWMRDPTRGGLATTLNELSSGAAMTVALEEATIPVRDDVRAACELLGIDPLYVANEGKLVAVVAPGAVDDALAALRSHPLGAGAAIIGEVREDDMPLVLAETPFGGSRIVDMLVGDPLPRIC